MKGDAGEHVVQPSIESGAPVQVIRAPSSWVLSISSKGDSNISLSSLFQCLIVLPLNFFFIYIQVNFSPEQLLSIAWPANVNTCEQSTTIFCNCFLVTERHLLAFWKVRVFYMLSSTSVLTLMSAWSPNINILWGRSFFSKQHIASLEGILIWNSVPKHVTFLFHNRSQCFKFSQYWEMCVKNLYLFFHFEGSLVALKMWFADYA